MDVQESRGDQGAGPGLGGRRPFSEKLDLQPAFLARFSKSGLFRILIEFDVTADGQPLAEFPVEDHEHLPVLDNEEGDGEIDEIVEVRHEGGEPAARDHVSGPWSPSGGGRIPVNRNRSPADTVKGAYLAASRRHQPSPSP